MCCSPGGALGPSHSECLREHRAATGLKQHSARQRDPPSALAQENDMERERVGTDGRSGGARRWCCVRRNTVLRSHYFNIWEHYTTSSRVQQYTTQPGTVLRAARYSPLATRRLTPVRSQNGYQEDDALRPPHTLYPPPGGPFAQPSTTSGSTAGTP